MPLTVGMVGRSHTLRTREAVFSSVQSSCSVVFHSLWPPWTHVRVPCPSPTPGACSNACPLGHWSHPTISSSVVPFSCLRSFPALGSFPMSQFFASVGQSTGVSASVSVLPMNIQDWFPGGLLNGLISLQSKGLSRVFSNISVQKHQFLCTQPFFMVQLSHPYVTTGKTIATMWTFVSEVKSFQQ